MNLKRTKARTGTAIVAALSTALLATAAIAFAGPGGKGDGTPGEPVDRAAYESAVATSQALQKPQLAFLKEFEASGQDLSKLPLVELAASLPPQEPIAQMAARSDAIAVVEVVRIHFFGSNLGDLPATEVQYNVLRAEKGSISGKFTVSLAGGPYRQVDGTIVAVVLPFTNVETLGGRALAFLERDSDGAWKPTEAGSIYRIAPDGSIADAPNATRAAISRKSVESVLAEAGLP